MFEVVLRHSQVTIELVEGLGDVCGLQVDPSARRRVPVVPEGVVSATRGYFAEVRDGGVGVLLWYLEAFAWDSNGRASKALLT